MSSQNTLIVLASIAAIISVVSAGFVYFYADNLKNTWLTGFATDTATVNITVDSSASINFTTDIINWGSGRINATGSPHANLSTSSGTVVAGNWTPVSNGLVLENIGNVNVTLSLLFGQNAAAFLGGTGPLYRYNVTNAEAGSCQNTTNFPSFGVFYDVGLITNETNSTLDGRKICDKFFFESGRDTIRIDIFLTVPSDSKTGALGDTITATAFENTTA